MLWLWLQGYTGFAETQKIVQQNLVLVYVHFGLIIKGSYKKKGIEWDHKEFFLLRKENWSPLEICR